MMPMLSCDTMVALPEATASGQTLFAKNSDRPPDECQPLVLRPRQVHPAGAITRCQFVELPAAPVTYRHIGSRPYWCWGYEHGFNEHQVVIGNEALHSRAPKAAEPRLIGMEIIRLGLERGRTAAEAVEVMTEAISRYEQGVFANDAGVRTYDNGYIVADPREAYVVEAVGRQWAVKQARGTVGISNVFSLGADWDRLAPTAEGEAVARGWWQPGAARFDWAAAYAAANRELDEAQVARAAALLDTAPGALGLPFADWTADRLREYLVGHEGIAVSEEAATAINTELRSATRRARSCALLRQRSGAVDARAMMAILRDHSSGRTPEEPLQAEIGGGWPSICMHTRGGDSGNTAASLVADLAADGSRLPVYWCSFYSPCLGVFLPMFIEGELPAALSAGGAAPKTGGAWWQFHRLSRLARAGGVERIHHVRERWAALEDEFLGSAYDMARRGRELQDAGRPDEASRLLSDYMQRNADLALELVARMLRGIS